jgi:uncharacterized protein with HEPN domain
MKKRDFRDYLQDMAGMRDKLIHEYSGVDLEIVWQAIQKEFPTLKPMILQTLQDLEKLA